jgi:hypothetical protein
MAWIFSEQFSLIAAEFVFLLNPVKEDILDQLVPGRNAAAMLICPWPVASASP